jgi:hypothetical protein
VLDSPPRSPRPDAETYAQLARAPVEIAGRTEAAHAPVAQIELARAERPLLMEDGGTGGRAPPGDS